MCGIVREKIYRIWSGINVCKGWKIKSGTKLIKCGENVNRNKEKELVK
jgi:hypothetical protein